MCDLTPPAQDADAMCGSLATHRRRAFCGETERPPDTQMVEETGLGWVVDKKEYNRTRNVSAIVRKSWLLLVHRQRFYK